LVGTSLDAILEEWMYDSGHAFSISSRVLKDTELESRVGMLD
jgi:hypothetical protein